MNLFRIFNARTINFYSRFDKLIVNNYFTNSVQNHSFRNKFYTFNRNISISPLALEDKTIKTPPFAESVSEGDVRWSKKPGDRVSVDDVIGEIETDKTAIPIHSPFAGTILELLVPDGEKVIANQDLAKITIGEGKSDSKPESKEPDKEKPVVKPTAAEKKPEIKQVFTKELHNEKLIREVTPPADLSALRVIPADKKGPATAPAPQLGGTRGEERVKMNRMRQRIAQRLKDAQNTCAMLTTFNEVDMSAFISLRQRHQAEFTRRHGVKLGFMSGFVKGAALALRDQPVVNALIDPATGNTEIVYRDYIDISVAVATDRGLVVPVVRDVQAMRGLGEIERAIAELGERARRNQLAIEDMDGGTFTISNGGVFGSLMGTPIINPPQSAILGIHATQQRPVAIGDKVEIRPMMYVALTYDHRLIDGREAVLFLRKIKAFIEDPLLALLEL